MNWNGWTDFVSMRGYGLYVWGAYLMTAAVMAVEPWLARQRRRRALAQAAKESA
jgi:heme exporter protein D